MKKILYNILFAISLILALSACSTSENVYYPDGEPDNNPETKKNYTVLVYMVANNNLGTRDLDADDINEMKKGILAADLSTGSRLLVYHAPANNDPRLIEITSTGTDSVLVNYDSSQSSVSIARMKQVIADAKRFAPASDYGLVLWSHGTGWLEDSGTYNDPDLAKPAAISPFSFGVDGSKKMSVPALAQGIGNKSFSFIYFDCCLMGTVEVLYELGSAAPLISASATELPLEGMPYDKTVPFLLKGDINSAAEATYHFYATGQGSESSCAIGVYNITHLPELAEATRAIMETGATYESTYTPVPFFRTSVVSTGAYDMADYIRALQLDSNLLQTFNDAYGKVVTNRYATQRSYGLNMTRFTGLGCNIVRTADDFRLNYGYRNLKWFNDVVSHSPLFTEE